MDTLNKLNKISALINAALLTAEMNMQTGPEVFINRVKYIPAKAQEELLKALLEILKERIRDRKK